MQVGGIKINSQKTCKICSFKFYIHLHKNLAYQFVTHIFPTFDSPHGYSDPFFIFEVSVQSRCLRIGWRVEK